MGLSRFSDFEMFQIISAVFYFLVSIPTRRDEIILLKMRRETQSIKWRSNPLIQRTSFDLSNPICDVFQLESNALNHRNRP